MFVLHNRIPMGGTSSAPSTPTRRAADYGAVDTSFVTAVAEEESLLHHHHHHGEEDFEDDDMAPDADAPQRPPVDPCLWVFHFIEGLTAVSAVFLLLTQITPLLFLQKARESLSSHGGGGGDSLSFVAIIERIYLSIFCVLALFVSKKPTANE
jgi:hypothetical protein